MNQLLLDLLEGKTLQVLDVGARGKLVKSFEPIASQTHVIGFEPDAEECERINLELCNSEWASAKVLPFALGRAASNRRLYMTKRAALISLLQPNQSIMTHNDWTVERIIHIDTVELDQLMEQQHIPQQIDFIKIDTQGSELEILQSGKQAVLSNVLGVENEVEFVEQYQQQPYIEDVMQFLRSLYFEPMLLRTVSYYRDNQGFDYTRRRVVAGDLISLRGEKWLQQHSEAERKELLPKLVTIYVLYHLYAEAMYLARAYGDQELQNKIKLVYEATEKNPARWYWRMMILLVRCLLQPTRQNRLMLAEQAVKIGTGAKSYKLFDVGFGV